MNRILLALSLLAGLPAAAQAQWQPTAELGVVNTTGNSETTSVNGKFALSGEDEAFFLRLVHSFLVGRGKHIDRRALGRRLVHRRISATESTHPEAEHH